MRPECNLSVIIDEMDYTRELWLRLQSTFFLFLYHREFDIGRDERLDLIKLARREGRASYRVNVLQIKTIVPRYVSLDTRELIKNSLVISR